MFLRLERKVSNPVGEQERAPKQPVERLLLVLKEIANRGNLLQLAPERRQRLDYMQKLAKHKLVLWNARAAKYELTFLAAQFLTKYATTQTKITK